MKVIIRPGTALDIIAISAKKMSQSHLCKNEFETVVRPLASLTHSNLVPVNQALQSAGLILSALTHFYQFRGNSHPNFFSMSISMKISSFPMLIAFLQFAPSARWFQR